MPERQDHGKNIIGKVRINPGAKSFILWVYDVLARYSLLRRLQIFVFDFTTTGSISEKLAKAFRRQFHSYRSATMGSTRMARRAGMYVANIATTRMAAGRMK